MNEIELVMQALARLEYDADTGVFTWKYDVSKSRAWNNKLAGKRAGGSIGHSGRRIRMRLDEGYHEFATRRLAYFMIHGELPDLVGVMDGDPLNDAASNLKEMAKGEPQLKQKRHSRNSSGRTGVFFIKNKNKWRARVVCKGIYKNNEKNFDTREAAERWVKQRRAELGFNIELHGRD